MLGFLILWVSYLVIRWQILVCSYMCFGKVKKRTISNANTTDVYAKYIKTVTVKVLLKIYECTYSYGKQNVV